MDSIISQKYQCEMTFKQPRSGFVLESPIPFRTTNSVMLTAPYVTNVASFGIFVSYFVLCSLFFLSVSRRALERRYFFANRLSEETALKKKRKKKVCSSFFFFYQESNTDLKLWVWAGGDTLLSQSRNIQYSCRTGQTFWLGYELSKGRIFFLNQKNLVTIQVEGFIFLFF